VREGDVICGTNGTEQTVIKTFDKGEKEIIEIIFGDGKVVECCEDHSWTVTTNNGIKKTLTVKVMLATGVYTRKKNGYINYRYYVPISIPEFSKQELIIDPYTLGVLIGDGYLAGETIEISIGIKKAHIIDKLLFPNGIEKKVKYCDDRNYFKIRITGKTVDGKTPRDLLNNIGLYGVHSDNKFIPKEYLYTTKEDREQLLAGLTDTDGYINDRGLLEYSTVSEQLHNDVIELLNGLGKRTHSYLMERKKDSSYSDVPIYRITELSGYKYGDKIVEIRRTGKKVPMKCLKVSGEDSLYFTDNYTLTHNTTSTVVLLRDIVNAGHKYIATGMNPILIKRGMEAALEQAIEGVDKKKKKISSYDEKEQVATISANNDTEIGTMIAKVVEETGTNGIVTVTNSNSIDTEVEYVKGTRLDKGYASHLFINNGKNLTAELDDPTIILTTDKISMESQLIELIQKLLQAGKRKMILIAGAIEGPAVAFLTQNHLLGKFTCIPVGMPSFGDYQRDLFYDLAAATGATVLGDEESVKLSDGGADNVGTCTNVIVSRDYTVFTGATGDVTSRIDEANALLDAEKDTFRIDHIKKRLGRLNGSVANIKVGGASETEQTEKKYRIEDALNATRSAVEDGVVEGGGTALLRAGGLMELKDKENFNDEYIAGFNIVKNTMQAPLAQILKNAGEPADAIIDKVLNGKKGYNALTNEYENLFDVGVIDPAKCVKNELTNAVATAGILLTSNVAITVKTKDGDSDNNSR